LERTIQKKELQIVGFDNNNNTSQCDPAYAGSGEIQVVGNLTLESITTHKEADSKRLIKFFSENSFCNWEKTFSEKAKVIKATNLECT